MTPFTSHKILRFPDRVAAIVDGRPCPPVTVEFDLTNACNHRCRQCSGGRANADRLETDEARQYLRQIAAVGAKGVTFTGGGEPLCHPQAVELVRTARALGLEVGFITNGGLLTREIVDSLLPLCRWLRVSLDASDPTQYLGTHGKSVEEYRRVWRSIGLLGERKAALKAACTVGVGYLAGEANRTGIPDTARALAGLGVDYLQIRPFHWRPVDVSAEVEAARAYENETFRVVTSADKYQHAAEPRPYRHCYGAEVCAVIQADSCVPLCCHFRGHEQFIVGRLRDGETFEKMWRTKTFAEVWYGEEKRRILADLDVTRCVPLCRCDGMNRVLESIVEPVEHEAFL